MDNRKLIIVAPSLEQPRIIKRIIEKANQYDEVVVYGFERQIHKVRNYEKIYHCKNVSLVIIGSISDAKYSNRFKLYIKLLFSIIIQHGLLKRELYVFGLDLRILCLFFLNYKISYEISDIIWLYKSSYTRMLLSNIDFYLAKRSKEVIFTSEAFYKKYFFFLAENKVKILENKFKSYSKVTPINKIITDCIRVAYIGAFRYDRIIFDLIEVLGNHNNIVLNFYGDAPKGIVESIIRSAEEYNNIFYHGPFKNPDDLQNIYSENNINFVAYDNTLDNEKVAMPNKFYESGFFNIPIVCSENTFVGQRVEELKMGWKIDPSKSGISSFFHHLSIGDIINCHDHIKTLDKSAFEY